MLGKLFKLLFILAIIGFIALVGFAYVGPELGIDFAPTTQEIHLPVTLQGQ
ncbi:hypothetical protein [Sulfitobacter donghicola]|uniref:Uncharacterized protein n=1 Tax=Sulfitobacter donghicola DSW-25 = KCTC 12864 = JCM 14565 TaxID=1300350 RepID=A0A073IF02_9RHOB|nr:hypothetical protein [Sulfitobacter donghicola]KEJ88349.1 hypothetical protein DSW25_14705 [Sulfitobacter donghicola DSW-25 = KCTC 12864 = JCM 14565]KIN69790.1 hypothetical protein Z948_3539 [Sulfitobacter donghicola DSW-25 = KCTC 12864 = JCM 14565]